MLLPSVLNDKVKDAAKELSTSGFNTDPSQTAKTLATWSRPSSTQVDRGLVLSLNVKKRVRRVVWHRQGDYFVTLAPENGNTAVLVHLLSKHQSQTPFKKIKGLVQTLAFHPTKPLFFVAVTSLFFCIVLRLLIQLDATIRKGLQSRKTGIGKDHSARIKVDIVDRYPSSRRQPHSWVL